MTVAKFYDIEQRLPFPGITYRIDVVDPVARHRAGALLHAAIQNESNRVATLFDIYAVRSALF